MKRSSIAASRAAGKSLAGADGGRNSLNQLGLAIEAQGQWISQLSASFPESDLA
jgi:hypothetical protein